MNKRECLALEHNKVMILDNMDGKKLLDPMVQAGIFSTDDDEEIREAVTRKACAEKFFVKLFYSKHKDAYTIFKTALNENGDNYIVKELEKIEKKYEKIPDANLPDPRRTGGRAASGNTVYVSGDGNHVIAGGQHIYVNTTRR